jgi:hypothetical protein
LLLQQQYSLAMALLVLGRRPAMVSGNP